jgi:asparagine synthase (glutamine-hydrolysing)
MCGIAGIISRKDGLALRLESMLDAECHRGPDDRGLWVDGSVAVGQVRLSILDLSPAGHQPMTLDDGRLVATFNGEIFNYLEVRTELQALGRTFHSGSDTEVLLHAYDHWGEACCARFNGMWGFAIYDRERRRIFCSRDRFGVKPFYFAAVDGDFVFASEIKSLLAASPALAEPNEAYLARFLVTAVADDGEETFFRKVRSLLPGHSLWVDLSGEYPSIGQPRSYWAFDADRARSDYDYADPARQLRVLLEDSVRLRLRADVRVGTCLSGGLDSSSIVALASGQLESPVWTFSALYDHSAYDETRFVRLVNEAYGTEPHEIRPKPDRLMDVMPRIAWHQDEPSAGPGLYSQWHVMEAASKHVKVLLDGQGADEVLGGYHAYYDAFIRSSVQQALRHPTRATLGRVVSGLGGVPAQAGVRVARTALSAMLPSAVRRALRPTRVPGLGSEVKPDVLAAWMGCGESSTVTGPFEDTLSNVLFDAVFRSSLPALLRYEDRNSMAFSIEARTPFLDYRLVEFALALPFYERINGEWTKHILRRAMQDDLPAEVTWRRDKLGYPTPFAEWLKSEFRSDAEDVIFSHEFANRGLFDMGVVGAKWREHLAGHQDHAWSVWRWLSVELWYRTFIDHPTGP